MSTHTLHLKKETFYFITFTCYRWLPLIAESNAFDYFHSWFRHLHQKHCLINSYCIMPNHLHMVCYPKNECQGINHVIGEAKRFLAYEIVKRLKQSDRDDLLMTLKNGVDENERKKGKRHQVFKLSFSAKEIDYEAVEQVMDYTHHNPVQGKWALVDDYTQYKHSSAAYYDDNGEKPDFLTDYRELAEAQEA